MTSTTPIHTKPSSANEASAAPDAPSDAASLAAEAVSMEAPVPPRRDPAPRVRTILG